jgi:uncharacterized membrane protein
MTRLTTLLCLFALSACGSPEPEADNAANATVAKPLPPSPKLAGVELMKPLHVFGTEPGWSLDLAPGSAVFTDFSTGKTVPEPLLSVAPVVSGNSAVYNSRGGQGTPAVLTLTAKECLEAGEPEDALPFTAELKINGKTLTGCAGPDTGKWHQVLTGMENANQAEANLSAAN